MALPDRTVRGGTMIATRTPFRFSFIGGGSDVPAYYEHYGPGRVVSIAVSKYMYIFLHPYFEEKFLLKYSQTELVDQVELVQHPIIKAALRRFLFTALDINSIADIPSGTGLGSSSAFTVGLLHALYAQNGMYVSKERLAREACEIEIDELNEPIGKQDQYASSYGGLNKISFHANGTVHVEPIPLGSRRISELRDHLLVFYTGMRRNARTVLSDQNDNLRNASHKLGLLGEMASMVDPFIKGLSEGDFQACGQLLKEGWERKQRLSALVAEDAISAYYRRAIDRGAYGGKLLGAGGGGFLLFMAPPDSHTAIRSELNELRELDFGFDFDGSRIIHVGQY